MCLLLGIAVVAGHDLLHAVWPATTLFQEGAPWWVPLHGQASYAAGPFLLMFVYPLLPWIGVILLGFGAAGLFEAPAEERDRRLLGIGLGMTVLFLGLRALDVYGDPNTWQVQESGLRTTIDFLNVSKYPPSLQFLLMTLGLAAMLGACADHLPSWIRQPLIVFGRAPFVFYVAHIYLIHALSLLLGVFQGYEAQQFLTIFFFYPEGYGIGLPGVYLLWVVVVVTLYPLSRWMVGLKARRRDWWLSYV